MKIYFNKKKLINSKGQSLAELAITLPLILMLIFTMMAFGFYIYDMTVYTFASNKALDKGIGIVISGKLSQADIEDIRSDALNYASKAVFVSKPNIEVKNEENKSLGETRLTVSVESKYNFSISFVNNILGSEPKVLSKNTYIYKSS
ncbi:TadE family protein [Clostridium puniceum]|nr:TadE family protein [Clostridium puniceum]